MEEFKERRRAPRIVIAGRVGGRAHAILDVRILDISITGTRIEHLSPLAPGTPCTLELPSALGSLRLSARVVRSVVTGSEQSAVGKRLLRYESGIEFMGITAEQQATLTSALGKLTPAGGVGDARLIL